ncbi:Hypothetical protein NTJ_11696 [Nesidiocoris tenuis]|uniref:SXP/RAL-2 family protein Ani s 5-like cation-binding domain-containing protein n=2 Tax=Nesidiocoris tenuis TaxID=355587 RepID=A0ABN7B6T2_9HEMI|nr:Hypothetical protein NTJ_11696 [Nesidiocoris tenuis]
MPIYERVNMSLAYFACFLLLATSQVALGDDSSYSSDEIMDILTSVNKTVNKIYDMMATQKDRDIQEVERAVAEAYNKQLRTKRDAPSEGSEALDKLQDTFKGFSEDFTSFVKNITSSDLYKQVQKFGEDLQVKGKELGAKIEDTIKNARKDSAEKS